MLRGCIKLKPLSEFYKAQTFLADEAEKSPKIDIKAPSNKLPLIPFLPSTNTLGRAAAPNPAPSQPDRNPARHYALVLAR